jgi:hypothetical protein
MSRLYGNAKAQSVCEKRYLVVYVLVDCFYAKIEYNIKGNV